LRRAAFLTVEMLRPIPSVALLPLSLLIFGFGYRMEIAIIAFATFWPSLILTQSAVAQIEPRLIEVARSWAGAAAGLKIMLPRQPALMTGLGWPRAGAVVAVAAEIISTRRVGRPVIAGDAAANECLPCCSASACLAGAESALLGSSAGCSPIRRSGHELPRRANSSPVLGVGARHCHPALARSRQAARVQGFLSSPSATWTRSCVSNGT
jgi:hypothetical protein